VSPASIELLYRLMMSLGDGDAAVVKREGDAGSWRALQGKRGSLVAETKLCARRAFVRVRIFFALGPISGLTRTERGGFFAAIQATSYAICARRLLRHMVRRVQLPDIHKLQCAAALARNYLLGITPAVLTKRLTEHSFRVVRTGAGAPAGISFIQGLSVALQFKCRSQTWWIWRELP